MFLYCLVFVIFDDVEFYVFVQCWYLVCQFWWQYEIGISGDYQIGYCELVIDIVYVFLVGIEILVEIDFVIKVGFVIGVCVIVVIFGVNDNVSFVVFGEFFEYFWDMGDVGVEIVQLICCWRFVYYEGEEIIFVIGEDLFGIIWFLEMQDVVIIFVYFVEGMCWWF